MKMKMSWEIRYIVSLQHQRTNNLGHKHKGNKWLISSILPGSLGREAQKSVDVKALKFYFHQKEVHEQVLMVILAMVLCYFFSTSIRRSDIMLSKLKQLLGHSTIQFYIYHLSKQILSSKVTLLRRWEIMTVSGSDNANATKKYAYLILPDSIVLIAGML